MKKNLFSFAILTLSHAIYAQTAILNPGFENWGGSGKKEEPINWNSNQTGTGQAASAFAPQTCFKETTNPHSGTYCARVQSGSAVGVVVNGSMTTGRIEAPSTNKALGYVSSLPNDPDFRMSFIGRPDSIVFWYRYAPSGSDYFSVSAFLHVDSAFSPETPVSGNHPDKSANVIARANFTSSTATVSTWTRVSMPFTYVDNRIPQYIFIACTSSGNQTGGVSGTKLYLDDFDVFYSPKIQTNTINPLVYYVSSTTGANVNVPYSLFGAIQAGNVVTAQLSNASGSFASPAAIGTATSVVDGTLAATIPAGTATGTTYRIRTTASTPALIGNDNGANITINLASNSISPATAQTIASNTNGAGLLVTESAGAVSRVWKYSTTSGGAYSSFSPTVTATSYVPRFALGGVFYVVCESTYPGGLVVRSNEVEINVIGNSISPAAPQSIGINTNGTPLTVSETSTATSRTWKFSSISGGPYNNFIPAVTATTYTPNFTSSGTYFVICESVINGFTVVSNEVEISVSTPFLTTGAIAGSPFEFSVSAPDALVDVPYTTTSAVFNYTNVFTAQLSDGNGSFANPTVIGSRQDTVSGIINAIIPHFMPTGLAYRIRVVSSDLAVSGSNNGTNLIIDQFANSIAPTASQTILYNTYGAALTVSPSQTAAHQWKYSLTSGSGYQAFSPPQTAATYTPNFAVPGTYYVIACSKNQYNDEVCSNEVEIIVTNGQTLTTSAVTGSPFLVSPKANVQINVPFTSDIIFASGNVFTAELSDYTGSFAAPVNIGTLSSTAISPIAAKIPNNAIAGNKYRIRVSSSNPVAVGTDNGIDLEVIPFELRLTPTDTQYLFLNVVGDTVTAIESHPATREWLYSQFSGFNYGSFSPRATAVSFAPKVPNLGTYYMICRAVNAAMDTLASTEIVLIVSRDTTSIDNLKYSTTKVFVSNGILHIWRDNNQSARIKLYTVNGQMIVDQMVEESRTNIDLSRFSEGVYLFEINGNNGKINLTK